MILEKQMECRLAGETEVLGENLPQHHFCPSQNPDRRGGKPATNRLSYGTATHKSKNNAHLSAIMSNLLSSYPTQYTVLKERGRKCLKHYRKFRIDKHRAN
jgi:hypothetical protein